MCEPAGWIKMHRKMLKWEWYDDINVKTLFIHCLLKANYEDKNWRGTIVKRGSFITSLEHLSIETKLTKRQILTALDKLILTNEIKKVATNKYTMLTILNYDTYQTLEDDKCNTNVKQRENKSKSKGKQTITTKEDKEYKEIEEDINTNSTPSKSDENTSSEEIINESNSEATASEEANASKPRKRNYVWELYQGFNTLFFQQRGFNSNSIQDIELKFAKQLLADAKKKNPKASEEESVQKLLDFSKQCLGIQDKYHYESMSLKHIYSEINKISTILRAKNHGNISKPKSANSRTNSYSVDELDREVQENWDTIYAEATKHCRNTQSTNIG